MMIHNDLPESKQPPLVKDVQTVDRAELEAHLRDASAIFQMRLKKLQSPHAKPTANDKAAMELMMEVIRTAKETLDELKKL